MANSKLELQTGALEEAGFRANSWESSFTDRRTGESRHLQRTYISGILRREMKVFVELGNPTKANPLRGAKLNAFYKRPYQRISKDGEPVKSVSITDINKFRKQACHIVLSDMVKAGLIPASKKPAKWQEIGLTEGGIALK